MPSADVATSAFTRFAEQVLLGALPLGRYRSRPEYAATSYPRSRRNAATSSAAATVSV